MVRRIPIDLTRDEEARFWSNVERGPGCWTWSGYLVNGRAAFRVYIPDLDAWRALSAHRVAFVVARGSDIPARLLAVRRCGDGLCVNPDHVFLGTARERVATSKKLGKVPMGVRHYAARLTDVEVKQARATAEAGANAPELARRFGTSVGAMRRVLRGTSYPDPAYGRRPRLDRMSLPGEKSPNARLDWNRVREIRARVEGGEKMVSVASDLGLDVSKVSAIARGTRWKDPAWGLRDYSHRTAGHGETHPRAKLRASDIGPIRDRLAEGATRSALGREYGVSAASISQIALGKTWRGIGVRSTPSR